MRRIDGVQISIQMIRLGTFSDPRMVITGQEMHMYAGEESPGAFVSLCSCVLEF